MGSSRTSSGQRSEAESVASASLRCWPSDSSNGCLFSSPESPHAANAFATCSALLRLGHLLRQGGEHLVADRSRATNWFSGRWNANPPGAPVLFPRLRHQKAGQAEAEGRFARPVRAENAEDLAFPDGEVDVAQDDGPEKGGAVGPCQPRDNGSLSGCSWRGARTKRPRRPRRPAGLLQDPRAVRPQDRDGRGLPRRTAEERARRGRPLRAPRRARSMRGTRCRARSAGRVFRGRSRADGPSAMTVPPGPARPCGRSTGPDHPAGDRRSAHFGPDRWRSAAHEGGWRLPGRDAPLARRR